MRLTPKAAPLSMIEGASASAELQAMPLYRDAVDEVAARTARGAPSTGAASPAHLNAPKYRPDIDGLRAVAVLAVIAFHAFPSALRGGFVGVDLFFVISGFLISTIIFENLEQGRFSYAEFYVRRIRRIFPALCAVLISCLVFGWFTLMPSEYQQLGKHAFAGSTFVANIALWREAGYFDNTAATKPLLHLWSLGVEEQFYIFWPLLASFAWKRKLGFPALFGCIALASFGINLLTSDTNPTAAFYSPLSRFWELMIGAALAWLLLHKPQYAHTTPKIANSLSITGLALIGVAIATLDQNDVFPGWRALLPTLGAFLVICAGPGAWLNRHVLGSRVAVAIGLISYPLYLWHWPLISFANILDGGFVPDATRFALVAASFVLAALTYRFIEIPLRSRKPTHLQVGALCALLAALAVAGGGLFVYKGLHGREVAQQARGLAQLDEDWAMRTDVPAEPCHLANEKANAYCMAFNTHASGPLMVVWGDSHAGAWLVAMRRIAVERNMRLLAFVHIGCAPLIDTRRSDGAESSQACSRLGLAEPIVATIAQLKPAVVFYIGRWSLYGNGWTKFGELQKATHFLTTDATGTATLATSRAALASQFPLTVKTLAAATPRLVIFQNPPVLKGELLPRFYSDPSRIEVSAADNLKTEAYERALVASAAAIPNVRIVDPVPRLCSGTTCAAVIDGVPMYEDDNHITPQGSLLFKQTILDAM